MKLIPLYTGFANQSIDRRTIGGVAAKVDDDWFDYLMQWKWKLIKSGKKKYPGRNIQVNGVRKTLYMHRVIMEAELLLSPDKIIDHKDRVTTNNQKENLRLCTRKENSRNVTSYGKSKYLGVYPYVRRTRRYKKDGTFKLYEYNVFAASIGVDGKTKHLRDFYTEEEAALCYNEAAKKYFGEFANLNVIK